MFAHERQQEIMNILNSNGKVKVKELSLIFSVTEDCIRKDLRGLESKGLLKRTYGGAMKVRQAAKEMTIFERKNINIPSKTKIAKKAFDLINDKETIFLDISTTNIILANILADSNKSLTVITNMLDIVKILSKNQNINIVSTGGVFNKNLDGYTGSTAIEFINNYKFNKAFVGSCGIDIFEHSITTFDIEDGNTKKAIINSSKKTYLVMEKYKFDYDGVYKFALIDDIHGIIIDEYPEKEIIKTLSENNIEII